MLEMAAQCARMVVIFVFVHLFHSVLPVKAKHNEKGHWGPWGPLSPCSVTCGSGTANMERMWIQGPEEKPFKDPFTLTQVFSCTDETFPECPQNGTWSGWGAWSGCTKVCGGGMRERHRECRGQMYGGRSCEGDRFSKEDCNREPCPPLPKGFDMSQCEGEANFTCTSKKMCIPLSQKCDVTVQCHDGSDEEGCPSFSILWGKNIRYDLSMGRNKERCTNTSEPIQATEAAGSAAMNETRTVGSACTTANDSDPLPSCHLSGEPSAYSSSVYHLLIQLVLAITLVWMLH